MQEFSKGWNIELIIHCFSLCRDIHCQLEILWTSSFIFVSTCNVSYFIDVTVFVQKECLCSGYERNADFGERGKLDYPEKISSGQGKEPGANE